jgi:hypothetical protein
MKAKLVYHIKEYLSDGSIQEIKIWKVPPNKEKPFGIKYSFAYIVNEKRVVGYDNAEGKGAHKHYEGSQFPYEYQNIEKLWEDFLRDVERFKRGFK